MSPTLAYLAAEARLVDTLERLGGEADRADMRDRACEILPLDLAARVRAGGMTVAQATRAALMRDKELT